MHNNKIFERYTCISVTIAIVEFKGIKIKENNYWIRIVILYIKQHNNNKIYMYMHFKTSEIFGMLSGIGIHCLYGQLLTEIKF